ncbi:PREDICTED: uncharacterized protein LOC105115907 [Populus euphratica]|uniref:Uncharacterized protein LOC105115907 n=1 Tax=Populus euphratica TaxID=75702 RepID=A0AAJ6TI09_POPEU|nr:PREDICTED: uncharacterized protein LOC105115907 [Populus euphratica]
MEGMAGLATQTTPTMQIPQATPMTSTTIDNVLLLVQLVKSMREMGYEPYIREQDTEITERWIRKVEKIMIQISTLEGLRVNCATRLLSDRAMTWYHRKVKEQEFLALRQGDMSILEYEKRFHDLSLFTPRYVSIEDLEFERCRGRLRAQNDRTPGRVFHLTQEEVRVASDVVEGMNWLSKYKASIYCYAKTITFQTCKGKRMIFEGERILKPIALMSVVTAQKLLRKGCRGYLAYILNSDDEGPRLKDIPMVKEFPDVFPEELPEPPPEREVEVSIDTFPRVLPIAQQPYRMALAELKELKTQLQELLDKGFIRPNNSS